ncbi:MAG: UDP-N-acetylmuramoyl-L-alanyl-D-glutamate--2,6-diaminopimelate ligase [Methylococcales bacterium]
MRFAVAPQVDAGITMIELLAGLTNIDAMPDVGVTGLSLDSQEVKPGYLFVALAGIKTHGMNFVAEAIRKGTVAVIYDPGKGGEQLTSPFRYSSHIPFLAVEKLDQKVGFIADRYFGHPSAYMDVIGITGTNGKTSCSFFIAQALKAEKRCTVSGTLGWGPVESLEATSHTTPDAITGHSRLAEMYRHGSEVVAMEVSSHGQSQGRVNGVRFRGALFTNFSRDHLDYHGSETAYLAAKLRFLQVPGLKFAAVNLDDSSAGKILSVVPANVRVLGFSRKQVQAHVEMVVASKVRQDSKGIAFEVEHGGEVADVSAPVYGDFNVENLLATVTVLLGMEFSLIKAAALVGNVRPVPGRMERFDQGLHRPSVIVDYAHTPHALESVLTALRQHCRGKLWAVFGCGGDRDQGKRPEMGRIAKRLADRIVLTDDNPRSEDGDAIVNEILVGCRGASVEIIRDRKKAIWQAIGGAKSEDIVLIAGKGHEAIQQIGVNKFPFSDRKEVREALLSQSEQ